MALLEKDSADGTASLTPTASHSPDHARILARQRWLPPIVGLVSLVAMLLLWEQLISQQRSQVKVVTSSETLFVKNKVESQVASRTLALEQLARRWAVRGQPEDMDWSSDTALAMGGRDFQAIEWVDPALHVRMVAPEIQNKADLGSDWHSDERRRVVIQTSADQGVTLVSRSLNLTTGGRGFIICVPVFSKEKFEGAVVGVFSYQDLLDPILKDVVQDDWLALYENSETIYDRTDPTTSREKSLALDTDIGVGQLTWRVRLWPKVETVARDSSLLPDVVLLGGIFMSVLLAFAIDRAEISRLRAAEVIAVDEALKKEIAERERVEGELRHAHRMEAVGQLAGGVAHSFNNMLMVIQGHAQVLLSDLDLSVGVERNAREIIKASDNAAALTRQLLAFSRKQILQPKVVDLNILILQTAELLPAFLGPDIHLDLDLEPELGWVKVDPGQIEQIIMNLVVNARDAMPHRGKLRIATTNAGPDWLSAVRPDREEQSGVILSVSDNGCGMNEETRSRIFEPFFSTKEKGKGTGLGLSMVYGTVEQSGGAIRVLSEPGQGTDFQIWFPRVEAAEEAPIAVDHTNPVAAESRSHAETVLVVEDDPGVRRIAFEFLRMKGYRVLEAANADETIRIASDSPDPIHLLLTDIVMPGLKGEELAERVTSLRPEVKVLYMSAYTEDAVVNLGILGPGTNFIEKPFGPDDLARKVRKILDASPI